MIEIILQTQMETHSCKELRKVKIQFFLFNELFLFTNISFCWYRRFILCHLLPYVKLFLMIAFRMKQAIQNSFKLNPIDKCYAGNQALHLWSFRQCKEIHCDVMPKLLQCKYISVHKRRILLKQTSELETVH